MTSLAAFGMESLKSPGCLMMSPPGTFLPGQVRPENSHCTHLTSSIKESNLTPPDPSTGHNQLS